MRLVTLDSLNTLRYRDNPIPLQTLRHWCRLGTSGGGIPAIKQGREWLVDLDAFDEHCRSKAAGSPLAAAIRERVVELQSQ